jgi:flavin-binding protein dodecin
VVTHIGGTLLADHVYSITEIAGSSEVSHADAIEKAIERASKTLRHLAWFEVKEQRGEIENGKVMHYQVIMKIGFRLED